MVQDLSVRWVVLVGVLLVSSIVCADGVRAGRYRGKSSRLAPVHETVDSLLETQQGGGDGHSDSHDHSDGHSHDHSDTHGNGHEGHHAGGHYGHCEVDGSIGECADSHKYHCGSGWAPSGCEDRPSPGEGVIISCCTGELKETPPPPIPLAEDDEGSFAPKQSNGKHSKHESEGKSKKHHHKDKGDEDKDEQPYHKDKEDEDKDEQPDEHSQT